MLFGAGRRRRLALAGALRLARAPSAAARARDAWRSRSGAAGGGFGARAGSQGAAALVAFALGALAGGALLCGRGARARSPDALRRISARAALLAALIARRRARRNLRARAARRVGGPRSRGCSAISPARRFASEARCSRSRPALLARLLADARRLARRARTLCAARLRRSAWAPRDRSPSSARVAPRCVRSLARGARRGRCCRLARRREPRRWRRSTRSRACSSGATPSPSTCRRRCSRSRSSSAGTARGCASAGPASRLFESFELALIAGLTLAGRGSSTRSCA